MAVRRTPKRSVRMDAMNEQKNVMPTAVEPTHAEQLKNRISVVREKFLIKQLTSEKSGVLAILGKVIFEGLENHAERVDRAEDDS